MREEMYSEEISQAVIHSKPQRKVSGAANVHPEFLCTYDIRELRSLNGFKLKAKHKVVLWALDSRGESIYPSMKTIEGDTGSSISTIQRAIEDLEKIKAIYVIREKGKVNRYKINRKLISDEATILTESKKLQKTLTMREIDSATEDWDIK
jgi:DNA-binding MarR family transcriptional regulator